MSPSTTHIPGLVLTDHTFRVPLDHDRPHAGSIEVYAREVVSAHQDPGKLPWLVFFQGGPGLTTTRPMRSQGWIKRAVSDYRVLLLDQRGTGRSTPATVQTLLALGSGVSIADYLTHFRADSIVRDAEFIRHAMIGDDRWSILGQSFGGFCAVTYLSQAPGGLREALITGGLPPFVNEPDPVYRATYQRVVEKNRHYYARHPEDIERANDIVRHIQQNNPRLPNGDPLSRRRFQQLGMGFGAHDGYEQTHYLLERAFVSGARGLELDYEFLLNVMTGQSFDTNPLYAMLHEACYCQSAASRWSAQRIRSEYPQFDDANSDRVWFTGEMVYPWMFEEFTRLKPLAEAANRLADYDRWPKLYDAKVLGQNTVPCVAAMYYNDMYVDRNLSQQTADAIKGLNVWVTSEHEHNGLRADGEALLGRLLDMLHG